METYKIVFSETVEETYQQNRRSLLLDTESDLCKIARQIRAKLEEVYSDAIQPLRMGYHIALLSYEEMKSDEYKKLLEERNNLVSGSFVPLTFGFIGKAFVLWTTAKTHITLAWFPQGHPSQKELEQILSDFKPVFQEVENYI